LCSAMVLLHRKIRVSLGRPSDKSSADPPARISTYHRSGGDHGTAAISGRAGRQTRSEGKIRSTTGFQGAIVPYTGAGIRNRRNQTVRANAGNAARYLLVGAINTLLY